MDYRGVIWGQMIDRRRPRKAVVIAKDKKEWRCMTKLPVVGGL